MFSTVRTYTSLVPFGPWSLVLVLGILLCIKHLHCTVLVLLIPHMSAEPTNTTTSVIVILSDDEEADIHAPVASSMLSKGGARADNPLILDSDDELSAPHSSSKALASRRKRENEASQNTSMGPSLSALVPCGLCQLAPPMNQQCLSGCSHLFCRNCLAR